MCKCRASGGHATVDPHGPRDRTVGTTECNGRRPFLKEALDANRACPIQNDRFRGRHVAQLGPAAACGPGRSQGLHSREHQGSGTPEEWSLARAPWAGPAPPGQHVSAVFRFEDSSSVGGQRCERTPRCSAPDHCETPTSREILQGIRHLWPARNGTVHLPVRR